MVDTTAPLSEVTIANMAAATLDEGRISSLDEDSSLARFLAPEFGPSRDELIRTYPWAFAKEGVELAKVPTAPSFGWSYAYRLPSDFLRMAEIRVCGKRNGAIVPYERFGNIIRTDHADPLPLVYYKRVTNPGEFDPLFARALGQRLALLAAQRITGKSSYTDRARALYQEALQVAAHVDSLDRGTPENYDGSADPVAARFQLGEEYY